MANLVPLKVESRALLAIVMAADGDARERSLQMLRARVNSIAETINWIFIGLESAGKQGFWLTSKRQLSI